MCKDYEEGIAALAEGLPAPEAEAHVAGCPLCAKRLAELKRVVLAARLPQATAPSDLLARAQSLMRPAPRRIARLLGNGLAAAGARATKVDDFALHVGADDISVHLHYAQAQSGWEVMGRAPAADWTVVYKGDETSCGPSGRFRISVRSLDDAAFLLRAPNGAGEIEIPSAWELVGRAP